MNRALKSIRCRSAFDKRITDQEAEYPIGPWPFVLSGLAWGIIFAVMWVW